MGRLQQKTVGHRARQRRIEGGRIAKAGDQHVGRATKQVSTRKIIKSKSKTFRKTLSPKRQVAFDYWLIALEKNPTMAIEDIAINLARELTKETGKHWPYSTFKSLHSKAIAHGAIKK